VLSQWGEEESIEEFQYPHGASVADELFFCDVRINNELSADIQM